jgi:hypothetical protein
LSDTAEKGIYYRIDNREFDESLGRIDQANRVLAQKNEVKTLQAEEEKI